MLTCLSDFTTNNTNTNNTMTIRQIFEALAVGLVFAAPFIVEIIKELLK